MRLKHRLERVEEALPPAPAEGAWAVPATGEEAARMALELLERIKARSAALDEALKSKDPERRAWARRTLAELKAQNSTPEAKARMAEIEESWARLRARGVSFPGMPPRREAAHEP